jgi:hypothetical protein
MRAYVEALNCGHCGQSLDVLLRFGVYNKRPISGTQRWSQHAAWQKVPRYRGNALDIHQRDGAKAPNAPHLEWLAGHLLGTKGPYEEFGMGIYHILWDGRSLTTGNPISGHKNHIHVDFTGSMINRYPDRHPSDGYALKVQNRGDLRPPKYTDEFVLYPGEGGEIPDPPTDPEEEDEMKLIADMQKGMIEAGYDLGSYPPYAPGYPPGADGDWGTKTAEAWLEICKSGDLPDHAHPFNGMTEGVQR